MLIRVHPLSSPPLPFLTSGVEPTYCMGDDIPLAVLSDKPHMLYNYFKQRFAQVGLGLFSFKVVHGRGREVGSPV